MLPVPISTEDDQMQEIDIPYDQITGTLSLMCKGCHVFYYTPEHHDDRDFDPVYVWRVGTYLG